MLNRIDLQVVYRSFRYVEPSFLQRFRKGRMGVDGSRQVLCAAPIFHVSYGFSDEFRGIASQNLNA